MFNSQYALLVALLRKPKAGGWSITDLSKALNDKFIAITRKRVGVLEKQGFVKTRIEISSAATQSKDRRLKKRRVVELAKKIRKPNSVVTVEKSKV